MPTTSDNGDSVLWMAEAVRAILSGVMVAAEGVGGSLRTRLNTGHGPLEYVLAGACGDSWPGKVHACIYSGRLVVDAYAPLVHIGRPDDG